jgi:hypothetical protein
MGEKKDEVDDDDGDTSVSRHISLPIKVPEDGGDAMSIQEAQKLVEGLD